MLFEIKHPKSKMPSWIFGTVHIEDLQAFDLYTKACKCIDLAEVFATELDLDLIQQMSLPAPDCPPLDQLISAKKYERLKKVLAKQLNFPLDQMKYFHPMTLLGVISAAVFQKDHPATLDQQLWNYAKAAGKTMQGLETIEEQMNVMDKIPVEDHLRQLNHLARNFRAFRRGMEKVMKLYQQERLAELHKSALKSAGSAKGILIYDRNNKMADRISKISIEQSGFFAFGAGHLTGGKGVIRLLKKKGFKVHKV